MSDGRVCCGPASPSPVTHLLLSFLSPQVPTPTGGIVRRKTPSCPCPPCPLVQGRGGGGGCSHSEGAGGVPSRMNVDVCAVYIYILYIYEKLQLEIDRPPLSHRLKYTQTHNTARQHDLNPPRDISLAVCCSFIPSRCPLAPY